MQVAIRNKSYQGKRVLGDIRFELKTGEATTLFGPSGCGKTTLLRILAGLDSDYDGSISTCNSRLGIVFQEPRLLPWKTVRENIALVAPDSERRTEELLEEMGLMESASLAASKLSLGMARRVALARALVIKPEILILDEPFTSLDKARAGRLRLLVLELIERYELKVLLVTHDPYEAVQLSQQVLILGGQPSKIQREMPIHLSPAERRDAGMVKRVSDQLMDQ